MAELRFHFDYLSPYAYLAHSQLREIGHPIAYRPFDIRTLMPAVGNVPTSVVCKPKNRYVQADLQRWVAHYGVPFSRNPGLAAIDNRRLLRATLWVATLGPVDAVVTALFSAMWGTPKPLETAADVAQVLREAGIETPDIETAIDATHWENALTDATDEAQAAGVFGAPCTFVDDAMFFGNDRLDFVRAALARAA